MNLFIRIEGVEGCFIEGLFLKLSYFLDLLVLFLVYIMGINSVFRLIMLF